ncbi:hypothetical protein MHYP_G00365760, partial [Metynnis hypsauchen]
MGSKKMVVDGGQGSLTAKPRWRMAAVRKSLLDIGAPASIVCPFCAATPRGGAVCPAPRDTLLSGCGRTGGTATWTREHYRFRCAAVCCGSAVL